ncbi:MAG: GNAT family N-acetyltransferase [Chloroflexi bacterium]|nr:MAG: GNAT family N-acetyltransferase [Chloroflexota bacterium]
MIPQVRLFTAANLAQLDWTSTPQADFARRYLPPLMERGPAALIPNVRADLQLVQVDNRLLPVTVTRPHPANSYVCSPFNHYFAYGLQELDRLDNPALAAALRLLLAPAVWAYRRSHFDRAVLVNNWLLSTNLYPPLSAEQTQAVTQFLAASFPDCPVIWRSVDELGNPALAAHLQRQGCRMVFSRQIYYQNPADPALWRKKQLKIERSLARRTAYRWANVLTPADAPRVATLYRKLYIEKYSTFNPQFSPEFFRLALENSAFEIRALLKAGDIDAVLGYYAFNGVMTQPVFGYDTGLPQKLGLYRLLSLRVLEEGRARGLRINASGGAGQFKRLRGGRPALEYNAVYMRHLPAGRRVPWLLLKRLLDGVAVPLIQKLGL